MQSSSAYRQCIFRKQLQSVSQPDEALCLVNCAEPQLVFQETLGQNLPSLVFCLHDRSERCQLVSISTPRIRNYCQQRFG